jgi:hypothetical protein
MIKSATSYNVLTVIRLEALPALTNAYVYGSPTSPLGTRIRTGLPLRRRA